MTDITIERCREYVSKCEEKGKWDEKARAIKFLLDKLDATFHDGGDRQLTIEGGERWLNKWQDVPLARFPHAVKLLMIYSNALAWHRGQRERCLEELRVLQRESAAMKQLITTSYETLASEKEPT